MLNTCEVPPIYHRRSFAVLPFERSITNAARRVKVESDHVKQKARFQSSGQPRTQLLDSTMRESTGYALLVPSKLLETYDIVGMHDDTDDDSCLSGVMKHSKSNSERGRAYRARRKKLEDDLVVIVTSLHQEVVDLKVLCDIRADNALYSRNSLDGPLVRLVCEYLALFERGMPSIRGVGQKRPALLMDDSTDGSTDSLENKQRSFIKSAMDPDLRFCEASGPEALLDQWRRYTSYHASINVVIAGIEVSGEVNNPLVTVRTDLHVVFSQDTFDNVFPHAAGNEELKKKFIGREIVYHGVNRFYFSPTGQILVYDSDVGFVDSLLQAGATMSEVVLMMQQARIEDECRLGDTDDSNNRARNLVRVHQDIATLPNDDNFINGERDGDPDATSGSGIESKTLARDRSRLTIDYLLS